MAREDPAVRDGHRQPAGDRSTNWSPQPGNATGWLGPYAKAAELKDPGTIRTSTACPATARPFDLISLGKDGKPGGTSVDADIKYEAVRRDRTGTIRPCRATAARDAAGARLLAAGDDAGDRAHRRGQPARGRGDDRRLRRHAPARPAQADRRAAALHARAGHRHRPAAALHHRSGSARTGRRRTSATARFPSKLGIVFTGAREVQPRAGRGRDHVLPRWRLHRRPRAAAARRTRRGTSTSPG